MVLVHRDSVNYETCQLMGKTSDPFNHQRCTYAGPAGQTTYSGFTSATRPSPLPLNLDPTYFDFGYNLFVDRFEAGCNWTQTTLGQHGPGYSTNTDGQVIFDPTYNQLYGNDPSPGCSVYVSTSQKSAGDPTIIASYTSLAITNDPGASGYRIPPLLMTQQSAAKACASVIDPSYQQPKRLMRRREFVAADASAWVSGEPRALSDSDILKVFAGLSTSTVSKSCNSANSPNLGATTHTVNFSTSDSAVYGTSGSSPYASSTLALGGVNLIGSPSSSQCISRFGAQDMVGNVDEFVSDEIIGCAQQVCGGSSWGGASCLTECTNATTTPLDPYNLDLASLPFDGTVFQGGLSFMGANQVLVDYNVSTGLPDGVEDGWDAWIGYGLSSSGLIGDTFAVPLGIPMAGGSTAYSDPGIVIGSGISQSKLHNDAYWHGFMGYDIGTRAITTGGGNSQYLNYFEGEVEGNPGYGDPWPVGGTGRYAFNSLKYPYPGGPGQDPHAGFRCAMPAE
jgi:hypothetical protein